MTPAATTPGHAPGVPDETNLVPLLLYLSLRRAGLRLSWDRPSQSCRIGPSALFAHVRSVPEQAAVLDTHKEDLRRIARWEFEARRPVEDALAPGDEAVVRWLQGFDPARIATPFKPTPWQVITDGPAYLAGLKADLRLGPAWPGWGRAIAEARRLAEAHP